MLKSTAGSRRLQFESLEPREVMAAGITHSFAYGVLTVTGTDGNDVINIFQVNGRVTVADVRGSCDAAAIKSIIVLCGGGNDTVSFNSLANGGKEVLKKVFSVKSGPGTETVRLADGRTAIFSGTGHSFDVSATGVATLDGKAWTGNVAPPAPTPTPPAPTPTPTPAPVNPANWFDANVRDAALQSLGSSLYRDGQINRADMLSLFRSAQDGGVIDATELADLRLIAGTSSLFGSLDYVKQLATNVVTASAANSSLAGASLGNLAAGSTGQHLENLVGKWFLGLDRPSAAGTQYRKFTGQLFVNGASYSDIRQGNVGDCYFLASLGEVALKNPAAITNMFIVNGDGTFTVRFYNNGVAQYVTVDMYLPTNGVGALVFAARGMMYNNTGAELWTALAEKAYVQINQSGWTRAGLSGSGQNSYAAVNGGYIFAALGHITGQGTAPSNMTSASSSFTAFVGAYNAGKMIGFASMVTPASTSVVGSHAYAVVGYNAANQTITLYNPWGPEYGTLTMTWSQIQANFSYFDRTA